MTVLIVEDNEISSEVIQFNLKLQGYDTVVARTGRQALAALQAVAGIGLIITDVMMPEMNGIEFLDQLRSVAAWKKLPVILCTSVSDPDLVRRAAVLGCRHFLVKPFQRWMLLQKVSDALGDERPILAEAAQVRQKLGLDEEAHRRILQGFAQLVDEQMELLDRKLHQPGSPPVAIDMSRLAEGAITLGAERLARLLARLQTQAAQSVLVGGDYEPLFQEMKFVSEALRTTLAAPAASAAS